MTNSTGLISVDELVGRQMAEERKRLERESGLSNFEPRHFKRPTERPFTKSQREHTKILFGGLTWKHEKPDSRCPRRAGLPSRSRAHPDVAAFQPGKEYGNNGQCNPTYFTVGNLVQYPPEAGEQGITQEIIELHLLHRRCLRAVPFRHVRSRVPAGAAQLGFRRLPRDALPAIGRT